MADISDVTSTMAGMVLTAVYPNGTSVSSIAGVDVAVFEGWPQPNSLDACLAAGNAMVSVFPPPGMSTPVFQVLNEAYVIKPAVHGLTALIVDVQAGATVTLAGTPGAGEYATIIANTKYAFSATGISANSILTQIAGQAAASFPTVSVVGNTIFFPTTRIFCNIGAPATEGWATHRQRDPVWVTVWAPNNTIRNMLASAINMALSAVIHLTFPDTSQGVMIPSHTTQLDIKETVNIYRRDLCFTVEYATLQEFTAYQVTSFGLTITDPYGDSVTPVIG